MQPTGGAWRILACIRGGTDMITILIADDEKLERNGIKFLLKREQEELEILEAINGKECSGDFAEKTGGYFVFGYQNALI